jgi:cytochrome P450
LFAANLDERISRTVWIESCQQAQTMLEYVVDHPGGETLDGLRSIAINVIGQAGYSQKLPWSPNLRELTEEVKSGRTAYFTTLSMVTSMFLEAAMLPTKLMRLPLMPPTLRSLGKHLERISQYTQEVLEEERQAATIGSDSRNNFLSLLLQLSDEEKRRGQSGFSLTDEEITGNLFIFSSAGFETTANTMGYAVILLAAHPEWQDWIREELHGLDADVSTWTYEEVYPKCRRTLAVMVTLHLPCHHRRKAGLTCFPQLETLRHFPPVLHSTRAVLAPQRLVGADGTHYLAPPMDFFVSHLSIHLDTTIWGPDAEDFKPSRWFDDAGQIVTPPKGTFLPWSDGPRVCPGMKMSKVDFVAARATLFRSARCEPIPTLGLHRPEDLQRRLQQLMGNSVSKLTLQVRDVKAVQLRWIRD